MINRNVYKVSRKCGRCNGSGKGTCTPSCSQCMGQKTRVFELFAHELTDPEICELSGTMMTICLAELRELDEHNRQARASAEISTWEKEIQTYKVMTPKGKEFVPVPEKRVIRREVKLPIGSTNIGKWEKAMQAEERAENSSTEHALGTRSNSLRSQRMVG